jgi:hypothetical protein
VKECSARVIVSGAEALQRNSMGMFEKVAGLEQEGRPVYVKKDTELGTVQYLYYIVASGKGFYQVGPDYKVDNGFVYSFNKKRCPEFTTGTVWQVWDGKVWASTLTPIAIRPLTGAPGPPRSCGYSCLMQTFCRHRRLSAHCIKYHFTDPGGAWLP